jgi:tetratricopeptide (TPR) repeat protein
MLDYAGPTRWRWRLTRANGEPLAVHDVELDEHEWQTEAFADLHRYVRANADPDRRLAHEAELVVGVGAWLSERVLGRVALELAGAHDPVRLDVPPEAAELAYRPWELAMVDERPLVAYRVSFVAAHQAPVAKAPVGERLRMLAVFGVPDGSDESHPRSERFALARQVHQISLTHGKGIELRVLQYGTTRERLRQVVQDPGGWDVVHVSGPDLAAGLVLTDDAGQPDVVSGKELADLLAPVARQVRLVTLMPIESAAVTSADVTRALGLPAVEPGVTAESLPPVAEEIARRLDCAVLAMRAPVSDEFAVRFAEQFYDNVLGMDQSVADAVPLSLTRVAGGSPTAAVPPLSAGTPIVFGARAVQPLAVPDGYPVVFQSERQRLAGFPPQPLRLAGRAGLLTRAATALAQRSGRTGVVLHGLPGAGTTTCAVELAYTHQNWFAGLAWYSAPADGDPATALADCALALERQLPGLRLAHLVHDPALWRAAMPALTGGLAQWRVLLVLDNVDSLLTGTGQWRDERWAMFVDALTGHDGPARTVITSRRLPTGLPETVAVQPVPALSLAETVLLAQQWAPLRALLETTDEQSRSLATELLAQTQGHPMLMALAKGDAADTAVLRGRLADADRLWQDRGVPVRPFLSGADPAGAADDYVAVLAQWADAVVSGLPDDAALLFEFLCCVTTDDRISAVVGVTWPVVWRSRHESDVPHPDGAAAALLEHGLAAVTVDPDSGALEGFWIHPVLAEQGRRRASAEFADAVAGAVGDRWLATQQDAIDQPAEQQLEWLVSRSALSAAPYLVRLGRWADLAAAAMRALSQDGSPATAAALLPVLTEGVAETRGTGDEFTMGRAHAKALSIVSPDAAEPELRRLLDIAVTSENAAAVAQDLSTMYQAAGRWEDALAMTEQVIEHNTRAGVGPWAGLAAEASRLQVLYQQGRLEEVMTAVERHRVTMADLTDTDDAVAPWTVRESILGAGVVAAHDLGRWSQALELNAGIRQSQEDRGAGELERAATWFNDYSPMLHLGDAPGARALLHRCRAAFAQAEDITMIGNTLSALADTDSQLGDRDGAIDQETEALRLKYQGPDPEAIAVSHYNLADYLINAGKDMRDVWAHRLAAAVIRYQTGSPRLNASLESIGRLIGQQENVPDQAPLSFDDVCVTVDSSNGVRFSELFPLLPGRADSGPAAIGEVMRLTATVRDTAIQNSVEAWEPIISALVVAAQPDAPAEVAPLLDEVLMELRQQPAWRELVAVLQRIQAGPDYHRPQTIDNLDPISATIARRAKAALAGEVTVDPAAWQELTE